MKRCPNCNRAYSDMVQFCSACGTSLSGGAAPTQSQNNQYSAARTQQQNTRAPQNQNFQPAVQNQINKPVVQNQNTQPAVQNKSANDTGSFGWGVLGFLFPIVGWILHHVWKNDKPNNAKVVNTGAWIGCVVGILMTLAGV